MTRRSHRRIWLLTGLLLALFASRAFYLDAMIDLTNDESWTVWQTFGSPADIWRWTPYDWPPGSYLLMGLWRALVGIHPTVLRLLPVLLFMLGAATLYRGVHEYFDERRALLATLAYAALGWGVFGSLYLRGYSSVHALTPVAYFWLLRYFDTRRWWHGVILGALLAALLYMNLAAVVVVLLLAVYALVVFTKRALWGVIPGVTALVLLAPMIVQRVGIAVSRLDVLRSASVSPPLEIVPVIYAELIGEQLWLWLVLIGLAVVGHVLLLRQAHLRRHSIILSLWALAPLLVYFANDIFSFMIARYLVWVVTGLAVFIGVGLGGLPRPVTLVSAPLMLGLLFVPIQWVNYDIFEPNTGDALRWISRRAARDDVLLIDPDWHATYSAAQREPVEWAMALRTHFDTPLPLVTDAADHRRIWYVSWVDDEDPETLADVREGRVAREWWGPPTALFRLYEAPPDPQGVRFENGMRFHGADIVRDGRLVQSSEPVYREGETVTVRLWWSVDAPLARDYSVGVYVLRNEVVLANYDSTPQTIPPDPVQPAPPQATSQWQPGQFYVEERQIPLGYPAQMGVRTLAVTVYYWEDAEKLTAEGMNALGLLPVQRVFVMAW